MKSSLAVWRCSLTLVHNGANLCFEFLLRISAANFRCESVLSLRLHAHRLPAAAKAHEYICGQHDRGAAVAALLECRLLRL